VVEGVPAANLEHVWRAAWGYLEPAATRFASAAEQWEAQGLLLALETEQAQLWIAWDMVHEMMVGAGVTQVALKDGVKLLEVPLVGGIGFLRWGPTFWRLLRDWGLAQGCEIAVGCGRIGWCRLFGFEVQGRLADGRYVMTRPLAEN